MNATVVRQSRLMAAVLVTLLLLTPTTESVGSARAWSALPTDAASVETRFEGYIKAIGAGKWFIGSRSVLVDSSTVFIEKRGEVEVGAWVIVWATLSEGGSLHANIISVERPAGRSGPTYQFSGIVSKEIPGYPTLWIVEQYLIKITDQTQRIGQGGVGWLVWVVAEDDGDGLRGIVVEAIADKPEDLPVEFEGPIEAIAGDQWRVDGEDVLVSSNIPLLGLPPAVNLIAEVKATRDASGRLNAHMIRVLDPATVATATGQQAVGAMTGTYDAPSTASMSAVTGPWGQPVAIAKGFPDAADPSIAYDISGVAHALWAAQGQIYYASQPPGQAWSPAERLATGSAPTIKAAKTGLVHALFYNEFFGNYEIYHLILKDGAWSLPINIARTEGISLNPVLAIDDTTGILRAAWMDNTPGYWTIYAGYYDGTFWRNYPTPNARGQDPALSIAPNGTLFLAWQDRVPTAWDSIGAFDIFISQYKNGSWSLPINISTQAGIEATSVSVTATNDSTAHLVWRAGARTIMYCYGHDLYWPAPQTIVQATQDVHGPRIIAEKGALLHVAWDEGELVRTTTTLPASSNWPKPEIVAFAMGQLRDVSLTETRGDGVIIGWADRALPDVAGVYASAQRVSRPDLPARVWLPLIASP